MFLLGHLWSKILCGNYALIDLEFDCRSREVRHGRKLPGIYRTPSWPSCHCHGHCGHGRCRDLLPGSTTRLLQFSRICSIGSTWLKLWWNSSNDATKLLWSFLSSPKTAGSQKIISLWCPKIPRIIWVLVWKCEMLPILRGCVALITCVAILLKKDGQKGKDHQKHGRNLCDYLLCRNAFRLKQDAALDLKWKTKNVEALRKPAASHFRWESILYHGFASPFFKTRKTGCLLVPHKLQQSTSTLAAQRILYAKRRLGGPPPSGGGQPPRFLHLFPSKIKRGCPHGC